ncbi:hypothetical protein GCM10022404_27270 [Celeribacter arenosi]|uniref:Transposase n=1 Tax=Celeribacter arenosi TaxID=792649 RepID=A0ABP7KHH4_9RHOB
MFVKDMAAVSITPVDIGVTAMLRLVKAMGAPLTAAALNRQDYARPKGRPIKDT